MLNNLAVQYILVAYKLVAYKKKECIEDNISIKLQGNKLIPTDHVKYLGLYIDKNLSWNYHIKQLSLKLSRANGILSKLRHYAPWKLFYRFIMQFFKHTYLMGVQYGL